MFHGVARGPTLALTAGVHGYGIFTPVATTARMVRAGELIGVVTDYQGREQERITSPVAGYVMYGLAGPSVRAGEAVVTIGIPSKAPR